MPILKLQIIYFIISDIQRLKYYFSKTNTSDTLPIAQPNVTQMVGIVINVTISSCINIYITFCRGKKFKTVVLIMKTALVVSIGGSTGCSYPFL